MKLNLSKRFKTSSLLFAIGILIAATLITIFAKSYFSEHVFFVNQNKYTLSTKQSNMIEYHATFGPTIQVQIDNQDRKVLINKDEYSVYNNISDFNNNYEVIYPNGHKYKVVDQNGFLMSFDEDGDMVSELSMFVNGQRILQDGEEEYLPSTLVIAAYSEHHAQQGSPALFVLSFIMLIYGWCGYRYQKFQNFLFLISLRWIWVNDAEPSDFYYFMCKVGGVLTMIGSIYLAIKSLFI